GACDRLRAGDERGAVLTLLKLGDHEIQNPAGRGVCADPLDSTPSGEIEPTLLPFAFRHHQEYQACVAALVADLGLGPDAPCPSDGQGKVGGFVASLSGESNHGELSACGGAESGGEVVDPGGWWLMRDASDGGGVSG